MFEGWQIGFNDVAQIAVLYAVIYALIRFVRGTRSAQILLGFCLLAAALLGSIALFRFDVLARIVYFLLIYLALGMVIVFQQEIRRMLAVLGGGRLFGGRGAGRAADTVPEVLARAVLHLSRMRVGALIAVERGISLEGYEESGIRLKALVSRELLVSVFTPPLPLHDGGIVIRDGLISAAHCIFPVSNQSGLIALGMRHRAAVGLSEETDALVVVVSEESGQVSVAHNGVLHRYPPRKVGKILLSWLRKAMPAEARRGFSLAEWLAEKAKPFLARPETDGDEEDADNTAAGGADTAGTGAGDGKVGAGTTAAGGNAASNAAGVKAGAGVAGAGNIGNKAAGGGNAAAGGGGGGAGA